jgi:hypothetical protein
MRDHPLPPPAREKLVAIEGQRFDALDAAASATRRMNAGGVRNDMEDARLSAVRERESRRAEELGAFTSRAKLWLNDLAPSVTLEMAPPIGAELLDGESLQQGVTRLRDAITAASLELIRVRNAPLPKEHLKAAARTHVAERAARGRPQNIAVERRQFTLRWPECDAFGPSGWVLDLLAWMAADQMISAFEAAIDANGDAREAMGALEKARATGELETKIDFWERQEEAIITSAAEQGIEILRRGNASPMAVLGLVIATEAKAQAAA